MKFFNIFLLTLSMTVGTVFAMENNRLELAKIEAKLYVFNDKFRSEEQRLEKLLIKRIYLPTTIQKAKEELAKGKKEFEKRFDCCSSEKYVEEQVNFSKIYWDPRNYNFYMFDLIETDPIEIQRRENLKKVRLCRMDLRNRWRDAANNNSINYEYRHYASEKISEMESEICAEIQGSNHADYDLGDCLKRLEKLDDYFWQRAKEEFEENHNAVKEEHIEKIQQLVTEYKQKWKSLLKTNQIASESVQIVFEQLESQFINAKSTIDSDQYKIEDLMKQFAELNTKLESEYVTDKSQKKGSDKSEQREDKQKKENNASQTMPSKIEEAYLALGLNVMVIKKRAITDLDSAQKMIKMAYTNLSMQWHPDKVDADQKEEATEKFKKIANAFQELKEEYKIN